MSIYRRNAQLSWDASNPTNPNPPGPDPDPSHPNGFGEFTEWESPDFGSFEDGQLAVSFNPAWAGEGQYLGVVFGEYLPSSPRRSAVSKFKTDSDGKPVYDLDFGVAAAGVSLVNSKPFIYAAYGSSSFPGPPTGKQFEVSSALTEYIDPDSGDVGYKLLSLWIGRDYDKAGVPVEGRQEVSSVLTLLPNKFYWLSTVLTENGATAKLWDSFPGADATTGTEIQSLFCSNTPQTVDEGTTYSDIMNTALTPLVFKAMGSPTNSEIYGVWWDPRAES